MQAKIARLTQKVLLVQPPFTQLNTPYPATAYLSGFLKSQGIAFAQCDLGIETILAIFSKEGLQKLFHQAEQKQNLSDNSQRIIALQDDYIASIDAVIHFLQGKRASLAQLICTENYLPEASRFQQVADLEWAFGNMGIADKAKHLATLYLEDLSDLIIESIDPHFGFSRYAERLGRSANSFDVLHDFIEAERTYVDAVHLDLLAQKITKEQPSLIALSVPFPGNLYSALVAGKWLKEHHPEIKIALGGGFANTELRTLQEPRVFKYLDYILLDDGEAPLLNLIEHLEGNRAQNELKRCFILKDNQVKYINGSNNADFKQKDVGTPTYEGLPLSDYIQVIEVANPMHKLWSDGRWNKLTLAHGCYWAKCTFCDISLDYIKIYEATTAKVLVDRMEQLIAETGENGFHFVDEAAPPALMRELALEILRRRLQVVWWANIRFEKSFTDDVCKLLAASGCIAVSGGLEVASDRLLQLIDKGVSVAQVAKVTQNFTQARIMVHAYLMYGFPTQTIQETIDSLEYVRQLYQAGVVQSGFWHRFAMTAHAPIGINPAAFQVELLNKQKGKFANNDLEFHDPSGIDHEQFSEGLRKSLFNYMHGICFEYDLQEWFDFEIPETTVSPYFIEAILNTPEKREIKPSSKFVWLAAQPQLSENQINSKKQRLLIHNKKEQFELEVNSNLVERIVKLCEFCNYKNPSVATAKSLQRLFTEMEWGSFEKFISKGLGKELRSIALLQL